MDLWNIGGALLGALGSGDKESSTTSTSEPWSYAQPWMRSNIDIGQALQSKLNANPFSPKQQESYGNLFGTSDYARRLIPSLIDQMTTQRTFDRTNPLMRPSPFDFSGAGMAAGSGSGASGDLGWTNPLAGYTKVPTMAPGAAGGDSTGERSGNDRLQQAGGVAGGLNSVMNGPLGIGIGMIANALGGRQNPAGVPVSDETPVSAQAIRDAELAALVGEMFGGLGGLGGGGFGGFGGGYDGVDRSGDGGLGGGEW